VARAEANGQNREVPVTADPGKTPGETPAGPAGAGTADLTLDAKAAAADVPPAILAQTLGQYLRVWSLRVRSGNSGVLPVVLAIVIVAVVFEVITPEHAFLRPSNLVYIFGLSTVYMVLAIAETVVLLLAEVDLSVGAVALIGGVIAFKLVQRPGPDWPWWAAVLAALVCCGAIGALQGALTALLRIPSFVVTLAGFLLFSGILVVILGGADSTVSLNTAIPNQNFIYEMVQGLIAPVVGWIVLAVVVVAAGTTQWLRSASRRRRGLVAPPPALIVIRIALMTIVGAAVVIICSVNRGSSLKVVTGIPWVIPIVLVVLGAWTMVLQRTRFGRYIYTIGGNPEAARRAGVSLPSIRIWAFALCSATAALGGILLGAFFFGEYSTNTADPGQLVLYTVAAAVIGGVSLFGGRGKAIHGVLGGLLIGGIAYGVSLLSLGSLSTPLQYILPGGVLLAAVLIDVASRRGAGSVTGV
jgi:D-xylose transport system permease protein